MAANELGYALELLNAVGIDARETPVNVIMADALLLCERGQGTPFPIDGLIVGNDRITAAVGADTMPVAPRFAAILAHRGYVLDIGAVRRYTANLPQRIAYWGALGKLPTDVRYERPTETEYARSALRARPSLAHLADGSDDAAICDYLLLIERGDHDLGYAITHLTVTKPAKAESRHDDWLFDNPSHGGGLVPIQKIAAYLFERRGARTSITRIFGAIPHVGVRAAVHSDEGRLPADVYVDMALGGERMDAKDRIRAAIRAVFVPAEKRRSMKGMDARAALAWHLADGDGKGTTLLGIGWKVVYAIIREEIPGAETYNSAGTQLRGIVFRPLDSDAMHDDDADAPPTPPTPPTPPAPPTERRQADTAIVERDRAARADIYPAPTSPTPPTPPTERRQADTAGLGGPWVSAFHSAQTGIVSKNYSVGMIAKWVREREDLRAATERIRATADDAERASLKASTLWAVTPSATFEGRRRIERLAKHSGLIALDFDDVPDPAAFRDRLMGIGEQRAKGIVPFVRLAYVSPSGEGVKAFARVHPAPADDAEHTTAYHYVRQLFAKATGVDPDGNPNNRGQSDVTRLAFLAHDPDVRECAEPWGIRWKQSATTKGE